MVRFESTPFGWVWSGAFAAYLPNVTLTDQHASMMNGLGQSQLENLRLQATLEEIFDLQTEHVIELHARLVQHSDADQAAQQSVTCRIETISEVLVVGTNKYS